MATSMNKNTVESERRKNRYILKEEFQVGWAKRESLRTRLLGRHLTELREGTM